MTQDAPPNPPHPYSDRTLGLLLVWCAIAQIAAAFLLPPFRTLPMAPEFWRSVAPGIVHRSLAAAIQAHEPPGPWWGTLLPYIWWMAGLLLLWVIVPSMILRREGKLPFSLALPSTMRGTAPYLAMVLAMIPVVFIVSASPKFLQTYPMLTPGQANDWRWLLLLLFWVAYATILFSTEFFFRGALVFALESRLGVYAVAVSVLPYCLIHTNKPLPEALGSIVAGYLLGWMALRTRSIGGGVLVHVGVALTMDLFALARTHAYPTHF